VHFVDFNSIIQKKKLLATDGELEVIERVSKDQEERGVEDI